MNRERALIAVILANTAIIIAGLISPHIEEAAEPLHGIFTAIFLAEIGWRLWKREHDGWMWFDGLVIAVSILPAVGAGATVFRIARAARIAHTLRHAPALRAADIFKPKTVYNQPARW